MNLENTKLRVMRGGRLYRWGGTHVVRADEVLG